MRTLALLLCAACTSVMGYEPSLVNCVQPADQAPSSLEFTIQHRFSRALEDKITTTFFGAATVNLEATGRFWKGLELGTAYFTDGNEVDATARYSQPVLKDLLDVGGELQAFNFDTHVIGRATNAYSLASVSVHPLGNRLYISAQEGYDGYYDFAAPSVGLLVKCADALDLVAEYTLGHDPYRHMAANAWSAGVKINTWGHQFKFIFSNATGIGSRQAAAGAIDNKIRLGFSIQRIYRYKEE